MSAVTCPHCGVSLELGGARATQIVTCGHCAREFAVPSAVPGATLGRSDAQPHATPERKKRGGIVLIAAGLAVIAFSVFFLHRGLALSLPSYDEFRERFYFVKPIGGGIIASRPMWGESPEDGYAQYMRAQHGRRTSEFVAAAVTGAFGVALAILGVFVVHAAARARQAMSPGCPPE